MTILLRVFVILFFLQNNFTLGNEPTIKISDRLELVKISDNSYVHVSLAEIEGFGQVSSNGMVFINNGEAIICDSPVDEKETKELINFIQDSLKAKITAFVPNHWHSDCMGGLESINKAGIPTYANQMTIDIAREKKLPVPDKGFTDQLELKIGKEIAVCKYFGGGHSTDNVVVYIPSERILFAGCLVKEMAATGKGNLSDADLKAWPGTIKSVKENYPDAKIVIPGHGTYGGIELLDHTLDILNQE